MGTYLMTQGAGNSSPISVATVITLQGMLTVFFVLALLWLAIEIMHRFLHKNEKKTAEPSLEEPTAPVAPATPIEAVNAVEAEDEGAIVAAIIAAISAMQAEQGQTGGFRVVSFKRIGIANRRRF